MCISRAVQRLLLIHHSRLRHQFQPCAIIEGDEVGAEISPGIVVAVIGLPAEIGGKEIPRRIQVVHIECDVFDGHVFTSSSEQLYDPSQNRSEDREPDQRIIFCRLLDIGVAEVMKSNFWQIHFSYNLLKLSPNRVGN